MCFSAEASFATAILLGVIGTVTIKKASSSAKFFLAAIPLLFAVQQFSEGLVWLHLSYHIGSNLFFLNAQRAFLTFAFLIWPIWIPFAFAWIEPVTWRRYLLFINLYGGLALSLINLSYAAKEPITVQVIHHSLQYLGHIPKQSLLYPLIVLLPMFLSSLKNVWIFGILVVIGYLIADYFYRATLVSVWCFFAAIVSLFVYKILKDNFYPLEEKKSLER